MSEESPNLYHENTKNMTPEERRAYREWLIANGHVPSDGKDYITRKDEKGRFLSGNPGGPGRPRGYRARLAETFCKKMLDKFEKCGDQIIEDALANGDMKQATEFLKLMSSMVPRSLELESSSTSQQLLDYIAAQANSNPIVKLKPENSDESE